MYEKKKNNVISKGTHSFFQYTLTKPELVQIRIKIKQRKLIDPYNSSNKSSNLGMGCLYLMVILFIARQSVHILHVPSFLGTRMTDIAHGLMLSCTHPLAIKPSTCC